MPQFVLCTLKRGKRMARNDLSPDFIELKASFLNQLSVLHYSASSRRMHGWIFAKLENFMAERGETGYAGDTGKAFIENEYEKRRHSECTMRQIKATVRRLAELAESGEFSLSKKSVSQCPECFRKQAEDYAEHLKLQGKRASTIAVYRAGVNGMLWDCHARKIRNLSDIRPRDIYGAFERSACKHNFSTSVRSFLKYLFKKGLTASDLSLIVPSVRRAKPVPSVYSREETGKLLSSIDRATAIGKRDYAAVLLALKLGMRSGDILNLKISDLDFSAKEIAFTQEKTLVPQRLELLPEIEGALLAHLSSGARRYGSPYVFLSAKAPFGPLSRAGVKSMVKKYLAAAGIAANGRKRGPHALRMTLASELVAENVPYGVVRKILGHEDPEAVKHYVKLDIERLRRCALEVPAPAGLLAERLSALAGGEM